MKLGQKVKFKKELKKGENLEKSDKYYYEYKDGVRWGTIEHDEYQEGIFCGYRTIVYKGGHDAEFNDFTPEEYRQVCLVATDKRGFRRVPENWLISKVNRRVWS